MREAKLSRRESLFWFWSSYRPASPVPNSSSTPPGMGWKLGLLFSLVGLVTVLLSTLYYFLVRYDIDNDTYEPSTRRVVIFSIITLLAIGVIYYVFTTALDPMSTFVPE